MCQGITTPIYFNHQKMTMNKSINYNPIPFVISRCQSLINAEGLLKESD